jgi:hypothetical protein
MFSPPEINRNSDLGSLPLDTSPDMPEGAALSAPSLDLQANGLPGSELDDKRPDITAPPERGDGVSRHVGAPLLGQTAEIGDARDSTNGTPEGDNPPAAAQAGAEGVDEPPSEPNPSAGDAGDKPPTDGTPPPAETPEPDDDGELPTPIRWGRGEAQEAFRTAVTALREQDIDPAELITNPLTRDIIDRFVDQGQPIEQISAEIGKSTAYVSQLIGRGIERLRQETPEDARHLVPEPTGRPAERFLGEGSGVHIARAARAEAAAERAASGAEEAASPPERTPREPRAPRERVVHTDLRSVIPAAQAGDVEAERTLFDLTERLITGRLRPYDTGVIDTGDVAGEVRERLVAHPFDASRPVNTDDPTEAANIVHRRYASYVSKTVRSVVADHFRHSREVTQDVGDRTGTPLHEIETAQPGETAQRLDITSLIPREQIVDALGSELQLQVFDARMAGRSNAEIAAELSTEDRPVNPEAVKAMLYRARAKLERAILEPAGLKPARDHPQAPFVRQVIRSKEMSSVRVLGMDYVRDDWVPPNLAEEGYVPLRDIATNAEAITFKYMHPDRTHRQLGRVRISPSDLPHLLDIKSRKQAEHGALQPPEAGYVALPDLISRPEEAVTLSAALAGGTFTNIIRTNQAVFVRADQARQILEALRQNG